MHLKGVVDHPKVNEAIQTAARFAHTRMRLKALEDRSGLRSNRSRAAEHKIKECIATFKAVCGH